MIVTVFVAIVSVPVRVVGSGFWAIENETDPLPDPVAPEVTVIHGALLTAVHAQVLDEAVTFTELDPEKGGQDRL